MRRFTQSQAVFLEATFVLLLLWLAFCFSSDSESYEMDAPHALRMTKCLKLASENDEVTKCLKLASKNDEVLFVVGLNHYKKNGVSRHLKTGTLWNGVTGARTSALPPTPSNWMASYFAVLGFALSEKKWAKAYFGAYERLHNKALFFGVVSDPICESAPSLTDYDSGISLEKGILLKMVRKCQNGMEMLKLSRAMKDADDPPTHCRHASTASDMSSVSSQCFSCNREKKVDTPCVSEIVMERNRSDVVDI
ncbi:hypothetical protein RHGRI_031291 [Rhododendron griersonianum]|uniref:Uncharacterized protein n=1 Tax=Rhododendron griersonianum TaxID=479676 RepID=A0AAV6I7F4_9ERIC|nr:hypothetical protein RHGRI_031291 [Rhododendron griersonianum]